MIESSEKVHFWCADCVDKSLRGWWIKNETPAKCDECDKPAEWVLVEPEQT